MADLIGQPTAEQIATLQASPEFDANWYRGEYPDVARTGLDPAIHYLRYGFRMLRDPGPGFSATFTRLAYGMKDEHEPLARLAWMRRKSEAPPAPASSRILRAAHAVAMKGDHARAIALAEAHLPPELAHTTAILRANAAIACGGGAPEWERHLNRYLTRIGAAPVQLEPGPGMIFDRLACAPLAQVKGGPLVSVIMPVWNAESSVRQAARSILNQTWRNLELLIVDDASTDGSWAVLQDIAASDPRVRISRNEANVGPYVAKNIALQVARGAWFTGQDADDWAHPQRIEGHMRHLLAAAGRIPASRAYMLRMDPTGRFSGISWVSSEKTDGVFQRCAISAIYDMAFFRQNLGAYDCARFGADNELVGRLELVTGRAIDEFRHLSMLCQDMETSLTNHPDYGIGGQIGVTPGRAAYKSAWQAAHAARGQGSWARYAFPPVAPFPFIRPEIASVPTDALHAAVAAARFTPATKETV